MAAAIINPAGSASRADAREAVTGMIIVAVAVFDVISVKKNCDCNNCQDYVKIRHAFQE